MRTRIAFAHLIAVAVLLLSACGTDDPAPSPTTAPERAPMTTTDVASAGTATASPAAATAATPPAAATGTAEQNAPPTFAYTYVRPDGNRYVAGTGSLPDGRQLDIALAGPPDWLIAAPYRDGSIWVAVLESGQIQAFYVSDGEFREIGITPARLEPGMPPLLRIAGGEASLVTLATSRQSPLTHPLPLGENMFAYVDVDGDLVITGDHEVGRLAVDALPDARILKDDAGRLLLLTGATERYTHGVLGDSVEASGVTLVEPLPEPRILRTISLPPPQVIEGIAPIWTDLTGDGEREVILTVSDAEHGARLVVFDENGSKLAEGPAIGQGFRWRHQIAVAPFTPDGRLEVAAARTPHIGGTVEFFEHDNNQLRRTATVAGFTSHVIDTRNLDLAVAGDFDGDGRVELLVPHQARTELDAIRRTNSGAEVAWTVPLDGTLRTNIAAVAFPDRRIGVGTGLEDARLRLWLPAER